MVMPQSSLPSRSALLSLPDFLPDEAVITALLEAAPESVVLLDPGGIVLAANAVAAARLQLAPADLIGKNIYALLSAEVAEARRAQVARVLAARAPAVFTDERDGIVFEHHLTPITGAGGLVLGVAVFGCDVTRRRQSEEVLNTGAGIFRTLAAQLSDFSVLIVDRQLRYLVAEGPLLEKLNTASDTLLGRLMEETLPASARDIVIPSIRRALAGESGRYEVTLPSGTFTGHYFPMHQGTGGVYAAIILLIDISDRRRLETALARSEDRYRQIVETAQEGIWMLDAGARTSYVNPRLADLLGYAPEDLPGLSLFECVEAGGTALAADILAHRPADGARECAFRRQDGGVVWALVSTNPLHDDQGQYAGALVMLADITGRRQADEALRRSEERYRLAVGALAGLVYERDVRTGTVVRSEGIERLVGIPAGEIPASADWWRARIHPDDLAAFDAPVAPPPGPDPAPAAYELAYRVRHADGHWIDVRDTGVAHFDAEGRPLRFVGATVDVSAQKALERAKDEFLTSISYELQTPLTSILGFAAHAQETDTLDAYRRALPVVERNAQRQARLVRELLDMSALLLQQVDCVPVPARLDELAATAVARWQPVADTAGVTLALESAPPLPVRADPGRILNCLEHLLDNAIKATPAGGRVTMTCRREGDDAACAVADTGRGLAPSLLPRLFTPFSRAGAGQGDGLGLGLAIVRGYVEWHGGRVDAASDGPGRGSAFTVRLPLLRDAPP